MSSLFTFHRWQWQLSSMKSSLTVSHSFSSTTLDHFRLDLPFDLFSVGCFCHFTFFSEQPQHPSGWIWSSTGIFLCLYPPLQRQRCWCSVKSGFPPITVVELAHLTGFSIRSTGPCESLSVPSNILSFFLWLLFNPLTDIICSHPQVHT